MTKQLGLIVIHGMGETLPNFANELESLLREKLGSELWRKIHLESIYYQGVLQKNQQRVWNNMKFESTKKLRYPQMRKFLLFGFSDASSLEHKYTDDNSVYKQTQKIIVESLRNTKTNLENTNCPLIIVAQSLGGQIISNYIWDSQKNNKDKTIWDENSVDYINPSDDEIDFLKLTTMKFLFTSGCNIPLFVAGFNKIKSFNKPNPEFKWKNYYDRDDILGWPLQPLSDEYNELVEDIEIDAGNVLSSWNPFSHITYWTDMDFCQPIIDDIKFLLG